MPAARADSLDGSWRRRLSDVTDEELLRLVHERPDDDRPRMVYADWLQDRGDPRGEFIALQLQHSDPSEEPPPASALRARQLERAHWRGWLGPLAPAVELEGVRFARGFLDACRARAPDADVAAALLDHPAWSTVRALDVRDWQGREAELVLAPSLRSLRVVTNLPAHAFVALCAHPSSLPLEVVGCGAAVDPLRLDRTPALSSLRRLELRGWFSGPAYAGIGCLRPDELRWLWLLPFGAALAELSISTGPESLAPWLRELEQQEQLRPGAPLQILELRAIGPHDDARRGWTLTLRRDAAGRPSLLSADYRPLSTGGIDRRWLQQLSGALLRLPPRGLTRLEVTIDPTLPMAHAAWVELSQAASRFHLDHLSLPPRPSDE